MPENFAVEEAMQDFRYGRFLRESDRLAMERSVAYIQKRFDEIQAEWNDWQTAKHESNLGYWGKKAATSLGEIVFAPNGEPLRVVWRLRLSQIDTSRKEEADYSKTARRIGSQSRKRRTRKRAA